ncbi:hypothetical protein BI347_22210 [Chromobacterium sphagni]|uniref:Uncharacterized protein n=1 Tax=Chromobacterium sphagni TaxID=1903179 RepID=A0A1S1WTF3_9NEIS|nr:hypothetical protein [Chromobacterium sphagni]OHX10493.1 hypothetical protein BI347_22210 [Chromobacterium sphagni]
MGEVLNALDLVLLEPWARAQPVLHTWYWQSDGRQQLIDDHLRSGFLELGRCDAVSPREAAVLLVED